MREITVLAYELTITQARLIILSPDIFSALHSCGYCCKWVSHGDITPSDLLSRVAFYCPLTNRRQLTSPERPQDPNKYHDCIHRSI